MGLFQFIFCFISFLLCKIVRCMCLNSNVEFFYAICFCGILNLVLGMASSLKIAGSGRVGFWFCELGSGRVFQCELRVGSGQYKKV